MKTKPYFVITLLAFFTLIVLPRSFAQSSLEQPSIRLVYFLPNDRPARPDRIEALRQLIKDTQQFYADEMERHGFGRKTFRVETDKDGKPVVHRVNGKFNDDYYQKSVEPGVWEEIVAYFEDFQHVYFIAIDVSSEILGESTCGLGAMSYLSFGDGYGFVPFASGGLALRHRHQTSGEEALGGYAIIPASGHCFFDDVYDHNHPLRVTTHELAHVFGLDHDFSDPDSAVGGRGFRFSECDTEWLSVSRFFNSKAVSENASGNIQLISAPTYSAEGIALHFEVTDADGLHQAQLLVPEDGSWGPWKLIGCQELDGQTQRVEFLSSELTSAPERVMLQFMDDLGNITWATFLVDIISLLPPPKVVSIPDPNLAAAVRKALGLGANAPITNQALRRLTKLDAILNQIKDLTGLEHATQLTELSLFSNQIRNISPLTGLTRLKRLNVERNQISNITPLAGLTQLEALYLGVNQINNQGVQRLSNLTQLRWLSLYENQISNIKPLANLTKLEQLHLADNQIRDVSPLAGLKNLEVLFLQGNPIQDTSPLAALTKLRRTDIDISDPQPNSGNVAPELDGPAPPTEPAPIPAEDVVSIPDVNLAAAVRKALGLGVNAPITQSAMQRLTRLDARRSEIKNLTGLEHATRLVELALFHNQIQDVSPLAGLTQLQRLYLQDNQITDITSLAKLTQLRRLHLWDNQIHNISVLGGLTSLESLWLESNQIRDIRPLAGLTQLTDLKLNGNPIQDTSPLAGLTKLRDVDIEISKPTPVVQVDAAQRPPLYWVNATTGTLHRLVGDEVENLVPNVKNATSLAVDMAGRKLYWTAQNAKNSGTINTANLDGTNPQILRTLRSVPRGIALDSTNGKLYLTNSQHRLQRINLDGTGFEYDFILNVDAPMNIAVSSSSVYWTDANGNVRFASLEGAKVVRNIATGTGTLGGIAVGGNKVYWTEQTGNSSGEIRSANLNGNPSITVVAALTAVPHGITVDTREGYIYWTDDQGSVRRMRLDGTKRQNLVSNLVAPGAIAIGGETTAVPMAMTPAITDRAEDVNQDKKVNKTDLLLVVTALGEKSPANSNFDVNADGTVNIADVLLVIEALDDPIAAAAPSFGETVTSLDPGRLAMQIDILRAESDGSLKYEHAIAFFQSLLAAIRPTETRLLANYPNPFNPETWIPYQLANSSDVQVLIYDTKGTVVRHLELRHQPAGYYTNRSRAAYWDGRNQFGESVASGIYFYTLSAGDFTATRKMIIRK